MSLDRTITLNGLVIYLLNSDQLLKTHTHKDIFSRKDLTHNEGATSIGWCPLIDPAPTLPVCVCVCVCVRASASVCVCVCVCVCNPTELMQCSQSVPPSLQRRATTRLSASDGTAEHQSDECERWAESVAEMAASIAVDRFSGESCVSAFASCWRGRWYY